MNREEALVLLKENIKSKNLLNHMYACEAVMRSLALHFGEDVEKWGLAGLLHDIDYEITEAGGFKQHGIKGVEMLRLHGVSEDILHAIAAHAPEITGAGLDTLFDKCMYATDPVTGLIVAGALIRPEKKLAAVQVSSLLKRFKESSFAKGANRAQIASCTDFGMELADFLGLALAAMQGISEELGL